MNWTATKDFARLQKIAYKYQKRVTIMSPHLKHDSVISSSDVHAMLREIEQFYSNKAKANEQRNTTEGGNKE